jgi:peptidase E
MGKNLLLTNLIKNYSFVNTKAFMTNEISALFRFYSHNTHNSITKALFISYAYDGNDINLYMRRVQELFGDVEVINITDGDDPVEMIKNAQAIVVGGGRIDLLERSLNSEMRREINKRIDSEIPYIGWNEGSVYACSHEIGFPASSSGDLLNAVPFQFVSHFKNTQQNRNTIEAFLKQNMPIQYTVCCQPKPLRPIERESVPAHEEVVGADNVSMETEEEDSGLRIEDSNAGLAGTESSKQIKLYRLQDGALYEAPLSEIGNII